MLTMQTEDKVKIFGNILNDKNRPLKERFRALFALKNLGGVNSICAISRAFEDDSVLLKHELAYCLGQMQDLNAIGILTKVLKDTNQETMVRHEAGEALGAIGVPDVIQTLEEYKNDPSTEVAETCSIALDRVLWLQSKNMDNSDNSYTSVDPSPPMNYNSTVEELKYILMDKKKSLFERYQSMFTLRNIGTESSTLAITEGLQDSSALFRHEIAFVLGQLRNPCSIPFLTKNLADKSEDAMVRHECAEALGAIGSDECMKILSCYVQDDERVVRESCEIALDMCDYENGTEFQYSDVLLEQ